MAQLKLMMNSPEGVQLIDVREPEELESDGRIPGAINIPRKTFLFEDHPF